MSTESVFPLSQVIEWAADITNLGIHANRDKLIDLIRETFDVLHQQESTENLRSWRVYSCNGCITLPREVGIPEKYKIGEDVGAVRGRPYEYLGFARTADLEHLKKDLRYLGEFPTFFDLPKKGGRVAAGSAIPFECSREWNKKPYLLVQGKDHEKNEVFTHQPDGTVDQGERVYIGQPGENPAYTRTIFSEISSVRLVNTSMHITFVWCNTREWAEPPYEVGLLAHYEPSDEIPGFRRYFIPGVSSTCCYSIEIFGKLRKPALKYDNEMIRGFDSFTIRSMLSANYYRGKNDLNAATLNSNLAMGQLRKQNEVTDNKDTDSFAPFIPTSGAKFPQTY